MSWGGAQRKGIVLGDCGGGGAQRKGIERGIELGEEQREKGLSWGGSQRKGIERVLRQKVASHNIYVT